MNEQWLGDSAKPPPEHGPRAAAAWWEQFNDPVLSSLVREASAQNLVLRRAGLRVLEARAARGVAVGQFYPQIQQAFGDIQNTRLSKSGAGSGGDLSFAEASLGLEAAWELDFWGKFRRGIEASDAELLAAVSDFDAVLVSLVADVASDYVLIRSLQERIGHARDNARLQAETLRLTEIRFKAGKVSQLDVVTAQALLKNTQALLPQLEDSLTQTRLALCVLLGRNPSDLSDLLAPDTGNQLGLPRPPDAIAAGVPADLLRRRPDVRAAEQRAAAECARIGVAKADYYPSVTIRGVTGFASSNFERPGSPQLSDLFEPSSFAGFIGLQVNWPILQYGRVSNNVRIHDARFEQAVAAYLQSVLVAASDVETGLSAFLKARERAAQLAGSVEALQRSAEISLIQYRAGAVDFIRVNNAQTDLVVAQDTLVSAQAAVCLGAIRTYRALGGGWEAREGAEFVDSATIRRMQQRTNWGDLLAPLADAAGPPAAPGTGPTFMNPYPAPSPDPASGRKPSQP